MTTFPTQAFMPRVIVRLHKNSPESLRCVCAEHLCQPLWLLTPSFWIAAGSRWTDGGTRAWWATWAWTQTLSSSGCRPPAARRVSPASETERSEERSADGEHRLGEINQREETGGIFRNEAELRSLFPRNWSSCWGGSIPPSSSWTARWSCILWWSRRRRPAWLLPQRSAAPAAGVHPSGY